MEKIPVVIVPFEDEMLYSYLFRLAFANGFQSMRKFYETFVSHHAVISRHIICYDCFFYFLDFYEALDSSVPALELFKKLSMYPGLAPYMLPSKQSDIINYCFRNHNIHPLLYKHIVGTTQKLNYCPLCVQEELQKYESWYYHRAHQMPGVKVCHKHNVYLQTYLGKHEHEFQDGTLHIDSSAVQYSRYKQELSYAQYVAKVLQMNIQSEYSITLDVVKTHLQEQMLGKNRFAELRTYLNDTGNNVLFDDNIDQMLQRLRNRSIRPENPELLILAYIAFPEINTFVNKVEALAYEKYSDLSESRITSITGEEQQCSECGNNIITTAYGKLLGWNLCDHCESSYSDKDRFSEILQHITKGQYSLKSDFNGYRSKITIKHNVCGKEYNIIAKYFMQGRRCTCEQELTEKKIRERMKNIVGKDYQYMSFYDDESGKHIVARHIPCGNVININYYSMISKKTFRCPKCFAEFGTKLLTDSGYQKRVQDIVGSEYTVLSNYTGANKKVDILHNACGFVSTYMATRFLGGCRCPICMRPLTYEELCQYVSERTNNEYRIIGRHKNALYSIQNTLTGKTQDLLKSRIIQELNRPTPSPLLPMIGEYHNSSISIESLEGKVIKYILGIYQKDDIVQINDIASELNLTKPQIKESMIRLAKRGFLAKMDTNSFRVTYMQERLPEKPIM